MLRHIIFSCLALGVIMGSPARAADEPRHTRVVQSGDIEIRDYEPVILAEVSVSGSMARAGNSGFRPLAGYIFGNNRSVDGQGSDDIAMTSPVVQSRSETIAMTSPVTQSMTAGGDWQVAFIMPTEWTLETLPRPLDPSVSLREIPARRMAVIRFSGGPDEARFERKTEELLAYLAENGHTILSAPQYARYDPPWVPTPFRRNEVMIEIEGVAN